MSSRQNTQSLNDLERRDLEDVVKVQQYVVGVTTGQYPFEHPGGPKVSPGTRYMPNQAEIDFTQRSRSTLYSNFFRAMLIGAFTPYITLRCISVMHKRVISTQRYMIWSSVGGGIGGMYGMAFGRVNIARDYLRLEGSPLATEARYQLWKLNPSHPFLKGFENETNEWNEWSYRDSRDTFDDNDNDNYNNNNNYNNQYNEYRNNNQYRNNRNNRNNINNDNDYNEQELRRQKRNRFYQTRNRIDNNDMSDFFDNQGDDNDMSEFFEGDSKQKWD